MYSVTKYLGWQSCKYHVMLCCVELDKHEKNPGNYWGNFSSSSQNQSSDEYNPENE